MVAARRFYPQATLTAIPLGFILLVIGFGYLGVPKWRHPEVQPRDNVPRAAAFHRVSVLTFSSLLCYLLWTVLFCVTSVLPFSEQEWVWVQGGELLVVLVVLTQVHHLSDFSSLSLPLEFTPQWLTMLLREQGLMHYSNRIVSIPQTLHLTGGCHSSVRKVNLIYQKATPWLPPAVIIKVMTWDRSFGAKVALAVRRFLPEVFHTKEVSYLQSYEIESHFYKEIAAECRGLIVPRVYYNFADIFNHRFGMIMDDVTQRDQMQKPMEDGQPNGFNLMDCRVIVAHLAHFHAWFWGHSQLLRFKVWSVGGYYTGTKRGALKQEVQKHWALVLSQIGSALDLLRFQDLGDRLHRNRNVLLSIYHPDKLTTLIHGDFKVSNIFIDPSPILPLAPTVNSKKFVNQFITQTTEASGRTVSVIDWQWVGLGTGVVDLAYFLATSPFLNSIDRLSMKKYAKIYHAVLVDRGVANYPWKTCWADMRYAFLDFLVYVICCKWSSMTLSDFESNRQAGKDGLHLRSLPHIRKLISTADYFMNTLGLD